jgi:Na+-transporting NADH:ubiquinone oxidoreductase subunit C
VDNDSPQKAILVVTLVALVCSVLVSTAAITLRPIQERNQLVERSRNVISLTGLVSPDQRLGGEQVLAAVEHLDIRLVDIDAGKFEETLDALSFDERAAATDPQSSVPIPEALDTARLGRRPKFVVAYLVWQAGALERIILPIYGQGMWSTLYGYIALGSDLNRIEAVSFYEQAETAGLGDQVTRADWQAQWRQRRIYDAAGQVRFRVAPGPVPAGSPAAAFEVDGMTGATVTGSAVTALIEYWFGPHGYAPFLASLRANPPAAPGNDRGDRS